MRGFFKTGLIFGLSLAMVLAAIGWISMMTLQLDRAEGDARRQAQREENVRLALWRMESALAPIIAQESTRPYFTYSAFYPAARAYSCMFAELEPGEILVPSPLLTCVPEHVLLHFQFGPDGDLTSPQVPGANAGKSSRGECNLRQECIDTANTRLEELRSVVTREALLSALPREDSEKAALPSVTHLSPRWELVPQGAERQAVLNRNDLQARIFACEPNAVQRQLAGGPPLASRDVREGLFHAIWTGNALVLVRRVSVNGQDYVQGCWLDWPGIGRRLIAGISDLLPEADLVPVKTQPGTASESHRERMLAALPIRLVPGEVTADAAAKISPVRLSLGVAWGCVLLAAAAVAVLLWGAVSLSERRGAFVSAVTHELRTPLTTFRMYTEMLAEGMVEDEEKRHRYLSKLRAEADRLSHLVENVLGFARLEGGRPSQVESVPLAALLERVRQRLEERAEQAGMTLTTRNHSLEERVRVDSSAVEQILFNLVDNACKYAAGAADRQIQIETRREEKRVVLKVRDHGPGIASNVASRLFQPFSKSDRDAANSAPGIGLGLALSRRLARGMGGDLRLARDAGEGACFELSLPAA